MLNKEEKELRTAEEADYWFKEAMKARQDAEFFAGTAR